ncbi:hypothetical protein [Flammeovirga sp. EKP202]|uniref:hypothetical protein n=1 Tax=Flammeovirga sp. EKP202 TaxID=2770592 RepID=UPI00165F5231|nr:hypothetical protein [Flammeovirga sp. EKP202]MBD0404520.1 hypothetical protein [Flammeovirga sp. EKP202]
MKLINTIEIEPWDYSKNEYDLPSKTKAEDPEAWSNYWLKCISDSNLQNLKSIAPGSFLVDMKTVGDFELKVILEEKLQDLDPSEIEECLGRISGGIVIVENDNIIVEPNCCGDLSDILNWEEIGNASFNKWTSLWIGHPWIYFKRTDKYISISDFTEKNLEEFKSISEKHKLSEEELVAEIKICRNDQIHFENRISEILVEMNIKNADEIAKIMTGDIQYTVN